MQKSESITNLAKALAAFQGQVPAVKKDRTNPYFKSTYATLDSIIETAKPHLSEHGLSYCQMPDGPESLTTIIMHESGEFIESTCFIHASKKDPQGIGSAITYFRRYALAAALGLCSEEDDDGNVANDAKQKEQKEQEEAINNAIATMNASCNTIEELSMFKSTLPEFVVKHSSFQQAGLTRYNFIKKNQQ